MAYRLLIDDPLITYRLLYCARKTLFLYHFFSFMILLSVLDAFFLVSGDPVDDVERQSANHKYSFLNFIFLRRRIRLQPRDDIDE